jgi:hypothetical protein
MMAYNFALAEEGKTASQLLNISINSIDYYQPEMEDNLFVTFLRTEIFYHLGLVNQAFFEYLNMNQLTKSSAFFLKRMADISYIKGDTLLLKKYGKILEKTSFYTAPDYSFPDILLKEAQEKLPVKDYFQSNLFVQNLNRYVQSEIENRVMAEYLLGFLVLSKSSQYMLPTLEKVINTYFPDNIPDLYQQALLYACHYSDENHLLEKYPLSEANEHLFQSFLEDTALQGEKYIDFNTKYKKTYFHYLLKP